MREFERIFPSIVCANVFAVYTFLFKYAFKDILWMDPGAASLRVHMTL